MKEILLLSGDDYVFKYMNHYYVREFGHNLYHRYFDTFPKIVLFWRTKEVFFEEELGPYNIIVDENVSVVDVPFFQGAKEFIWVRSKIIQQAKKALNHVNYANIRIPSNTGFTILPLLRKYKIPYTVEIVANPYELFLNSHSILGHASMYIWHIQTQKACRYAAGISYVTKEALQRIYKHRNDQFTENYSSIDINDSYFLGSRKWAFPKKIIICHIASVIKDDSKGNKEAIDVIKLLVNDGFDVELRCTGEGSYIETLKRYSVEKGVSGRVVFCGVLNKQQLFQLLKDSDVMLFPSKSEGLPRVIIEAFATGLPCVASNVGGIPELLTSDMMFSYNDIIGMTNKLKELFTDYVLYEKKSQESYIKSQEYKPEILREKRLRFFKQLSIINNKI